MSENLLQPSYGLSNSKLTLANAIPSQVLSGQTFYSGDKTLKTGSMVNRWNWSSAISPGGSVTIPEGYHNGTGVVTANSAPSGVIDVLGSLTNTSSSFSKTISSGYKSFIWVHYCDYDNGYTVPASPSISSGSLSQVFTIQGLGWIWVINNASMPFTITSRVNKGFGYQYMLLLGVR